MPLSSKLALIMGKALFLYHVGIHAGHGCLQDVIIMVYEMKVQRNTKYRCRLAL